jgi:hypothetical protein
MKRHMETHVAQLTRAGACRLFDTACEVAAERGMLIHELDPQLTEELLRYFPRTFNGERSPH